MRIDEARRSFVRDERGAVLVLGVFMCACMVGALWYLAGIGDALIYRERLQEGTDAVAFSAAALHARGMNLIALLNLVMACILAVRVTLKAVQAGFALAAVICLFPPLTAFEGTALQGLKLTEDAIRATREPINKTLKALSRTQNVIKTLVPGAAVAGALQVGNKYEPLVREASAANPTRLTGLPIEEGSIDRLCSKAGESVVGLLSFAIPVPLPGVLEDKIGKVVGRTVSAGGVYFCEMGTGPAKPPDLSSDIESAAKEGCDKQKGEKKKALDESQAAYDSACRRYGAACESGGTTSSSLTPDAEREISLAKSKRDAAQADVAAFDVDRCVTQNKTQGQQRYTADPNVKIDPGNGMTPKKMRASFENGGSDAQLIGLGYGNTDSLETSPKLVKIGQWKHQSEITLPRSADVAFAQAEYFYDCDGRWNSATCNGAGANDQLALWHLRWRARLRRCNAGLAGFAAAASATELFSRNLDAMPRLESITADNADVVTQLGNATRDGLLH